MNHLKFKLLSVLTCLIVWFGAKAEGDFRVEGVAADTTGTGLPYATFHIYHLPDTLKPAVNGVTDSIGVFDRALPAAGNYRLRIAAFGVDPVSRDFSVSTESPVASLGTLIAGSGDNVLGEVTVTAMKPLVSREIDRIGYDVESDPDSKTSQLDEMLKKVPMVTVEADGTIKIKGQSSFIIYKNGRKNNSFSNNAKDIFKSIPASMIKKIEVITDPGAREDAEGVSTILNIVTVDNMVIKGVMGSASMWYNSMGNFPNPSLWLMSQIDKVTFNVYGSYSNFPSRSGREIHRTSQTFDNSDNHSNEQTIQSVSRNSGNIGLEASYEMDSLNLFTAEFNAYIGSSRTRAHFEYGMFTSDDDPIYSYNSYRLTDPSRYHWLGGNFNYQRLTRKKGEKIILSYNISGNGNKTKQTDTYYNQINMPVEYNGINIDNSAVFLEHTFQADWTRPLASGHTLDVGGKYIYRDNHSKSDQNYVDDRVVKTDFSHITQVAALFFDYRINIGRFGARAGLRYEFSRLAAKFHDGSGNDFHSDLNDLVPNAAISYQLDDRSSLRLSYSSSIQRPGINYLNPTVNTTPQSISVGNPDLGSVRNQSVNLNYGLFTRKINLDFNVSYGFSNNAIIQILELRPNDIKYSTYENAGRNRNVNMNLYLSWQSGSKTRIMLNGGVTYSHFENRNLLAKIGQWRPNGYLRFTQTLPWKLNLGVYGSYWGGSKSFYSVFEPVGISVFGHGLDLSRSFLKENRLNIRVGVNNPIGNGRSRYRSYAINVPYQSVSTSTENNRMFTFSVSYRFGSLQAQVKKVSGGIQNNDLIGGPSR